MPHYHAVVWIDHASARVFAFNAEDVEKQTIRSHHSHRQVHHRTGTLGTGREDDDLDYFRAVADALAEAAEVLVIGPAQTKTRFAAWAEAHDAGLRARILAVEPADHPTDAQVVALARQYFRAADRMRPQR